MTASTFVDRLMLIDGAEAESVTGRHFTRSSPAHDTPSHAIHRRVRRTSTSRFAPLAVRSMRAAGRRPRAPSALAC